MLQQDKARDMQALFWNDCQLIYIDAEIRSLHGAKFWYQGMQGKVNVEVGADKSTERHEMCISSIQSPGITNTQTKR